MLFTAISEADDIFTNSLIRHNTQDNVDYKGKRVLVLGGGSGTLLAAVLKQQAKYVLVVEVWGYDLCLFLNS